MVGLGHVTFYPLINQGALIGWIRSPDFLVNITARSRSRAIIACGRNNKLYFYGTQTQTDWLDLPNPTNNAYPLDMCIVVNLCATLDISAHSIRVEFHVNFPSDTSSFLSYDLTCIIKTIIHIVTTVSSSR